MDDIDAWAATDGLPEVADDDSYADGVHEAARDRDAPGALPPDREDGPLGLEDYGITSAQRSRGEPLSARLAREVPDVYLGPAHEDPDPRLTEDLDPDAEQQVDEDSRILDEAEPIDPRLGSQVSMYDRPVQGIPSPPDQRTGPSGQRLRLGRGRRDRLRPGASDGRPRQ